MRMMLSVLFNCDHKLFFGTLRSILWEGGDNISIGRGMGERRSYYYMKIMSGGFKNTKKIFYNRTISSAPIQ